MLIIIGCVIGVVGCVTVLRVRNPWTLERPQLGYMSQQWLAEHRAAAMS